MELPCKSNLYPLLTVYSPVGSPLQARKSSCGKRASEIWRIRWASTSEKMFIILSPYILLDIDIPARSHPPTES
ncbi:hypothetical protein ES288_A07G120700v1 [Gossypium darwinii]|uniref:Uncharacterized protein n=1 Tax=Gossypium darwinii TaxID=34276 RepID=A0A5D2FWK1_GOSDA|nr:hypothetical protein ES288_A07G120700v1 [Gossypium darwinii]